MSAETQRLTVTEELDGKRLDAALAQLLPQFTRSLLAQLIESGNVQKNGVLCAKSVKVKALDELSVTLPVAQETELVAQDIPLDIVYEDEDLLVVNKPKDMVVHPAAGNPDKTLVNALMYHCKGSLSGINGELRPGIVHRIDKDTSGLLVVAKNDMAHVGLSEQLACHSMNRIYQAVVYGKLKTDAGEINAPIGRSQKDRKKMAITDKNSKIAVTGYEVLTRYKGFTHVQLKLKTGRTHQIRVHMASIGHPVAGDVVYGPKSAIKELNGQCLHAGVLGFVHPRTGEYMEFTAPLPPYFSAFLAKLQREE